MSLWVLLLVTYCVVGVIKLRFFDRNNEGDWLAMLSDQRNRRCNVIWVYVCLLVSLLTWPVAIFSKKVCFTRWFFRFQWR